MEARLLAMLILVGLVAILFGIWAYVLRTNVGTERRQVVLALVQFALITGFFATSAAVLAFFGAEIDPLAIGIVGMGLLVVSMVLGVVAGKKIYSVWLRRRMDSRAVDHVLRNT